MSATPSSGDHQGIVDEIKALRIEPGQALRQVRVPERAYITAKRFLKWAPNVLTAHEQEGFRFKTLYYMPNGENIYLLLIRDAYATSLGDAHEKINEWQEAVKSLLRYALNLLLAPKRPEFQSIKLSSSFYVYQVAKKLQGAENILHCMGYKRVSPSKGSQELVYNSDTNDSSKVILTAADLIVLHSEFERIKDLVTGAIQSKYVNMLLCDILEARREPNDSLDKTLARSFKYTLQRLQWQKQNQNQLRVQQQQQQHSQVTSAEALHFSAPVHHKKHMQLGQDQRQCQSSYLQHTSSNPSESQQNEFLPNTKAASQYDSHSKGEYTTQSDHLLPFKDPNVVSKQYSKYTEKGIDNVPKQDCVLESTTDTDSLCSSSQLPKSIPSPMNLPEPVYEYEDLQIASPDNPDFYSSGHLSLMVNARSTDIDFSSSTLMSDDSGHMGLGESAQISQHETGDSGEQQQVHEEIFVPFSNKIERVPSVTYEIVDNFKETQHQLQDVSKTSPKPKPRQRTQNHLTNLSPQPTPPTSPRHPVAKPCTKKIINTSPPASNVMPSQQCDSTTSSNSENIYSTTSVSMMEVPSIQSEGSPALNSIESDSAQNSLESDPIRSKRSSPCPTVSPDPASSADSMNNNNKVREIGEIEEGFVMISTSESEATATHEDNVPIIGCRPRAAAVSAGNKGTTVVTQSRGLDLECAEGTTESADITDISLSLLSPSNSLSNTWQCEYCMNLVHFELSNCDICGNEQQPQ